MIKQLTTSILASFILLGCVYMTITGPDEVQSSQEMADWTTELQSMAKQDEEYMRKNGAFSK